MVVFNDLIGTKKEGREVVRERKRGRKERKELERERGKEREGKRERRKERERLCLGGGHRKKEERTSPSESKREGERG